MNTANYMETQVPGRTEQPVRTTTTATGTYTTVMKQKRNTKSYKTLYKEKVKENDSLVNKCLILALLTASLAVMVICQIVYWLITK